MRAVLIAAPLALLAAAPAAALEVGETHPRTLEDGPLLTAGGVATSELRGERRFIRFYGAGGDRTLHRGSALVAREEDGDDFSGEYSSESAQLAASGALVAHGRSATSGNSKYMQGVSSAGIFAGPPTAALATLAACSGDVQDPALRTSSAVAADGTRVAHAGCSDRIAIRDLAPGGATVLAPPGLGRGLLALAGDHLAAWGTDSRIRVVNWRTGVSLYATPPRFSPTFDLAPDGTLAVVDFGSAGLPDCETGTLEWFSPAQPTSHPLAPKPCSAVASLAAGRVLVIREGAESGSRALSLVALTGGVRDLATVRNRAVLAGRADFDGERYSFAVGGCRGGADLRTGQVTDRAVSGVAARCPFRVVGRPRLRGRRVVVPVRCSDGCRGRVSLVALVGRRRVPIGSKGFSRAARPRCGSASRIGAGLSKRGRRLLRMRGLVRVRLVFGVDDRAGVRRRRASRTVTLSNAAAGSAQRRC